MATTKRVAKKAAKKAVPKVEKVKQIVLTQEQFDTLASIKNELDDLTDKLLSTFNQYDTNDNLKSIGFEVGRTYEGIINQYNKLTGLVVDIDPNPVEDYSWDEFEGDDNDN